MKKEVKTVTKIKISDNGKINVPSEINMSIAEIADLFGIYYQTAKRAIRAIEKSDVASGDYPMCCTVESTKIYPDYYGLDMVVAVAFRVQSTKTEIFRQWLVNKVIRHDITATLVLPLQNAMLN